MTQQLSNSLENPTSTVEVNKLVLLKMVLSFTITLERLANLNPEKNIQELYDEITDNASAQIENLPEAQINEMTAAAIEPD